MLKVRSEAVMGLITQTGCVSVSVYPQDISAAAVTISTLECLVMGQSIVIMAQSFPTR